jgi:hypothetical protein
MEESEGNRTRWRTVGVIAALALGVSAFGGFVLPELRADTSSGPVERPLVLSKLTHERDCDRSERRPEI